MHGVVSYILLSPAASIDNRHCTQRTHKPTLAAAVIQKGDIFSRTMERRVFVEGTRLPASPPFNPNKTTQTHDG